MIALFSFESTSTRLTGTGLRITYFAIQAVPATFVLTVFSILSGVANWKSIVCLKFQKGSLSPPWYYWLTPKSQIHKLKCIHNRYKLNIAFIYFFFKDDCFVKDVLLTHKHRSIYKVNAKKAFKKKGMSSIKHCNILLKAFLSGNWKVS